MTRSRRPTSLKVPSAMLALATVLAAAAASPAAASRVARETGTVRTAGTAAAQASGTAGAGTAEAAPTAGLGSPRPEGNGGGDFTGLWEGQIVYKRAAVEFDLTVEIFRGADGALLGTVDLPSERVKFRPLRHIEVQGRHLNMEFLLDSEVRGPDATFKLQADLAPDGKTMRGVFVESGGSRPFFLDRRGDPGSERPPERRSPVTNLSDQAAELKTAFNRDADRVRLVLLLSPT